jgi:sec-independent protein translocase protein TatC
MEKLLSAFLPIPLKPSSTSGKKDASDPDDSIARYLPYLEEIQKRLIVVVIVFLLSALLGAIFYKDILVFIMRHFDLTGINMVLTSPYQVIELAIQTGITIGLIIAMPLLIYYLISFLRPALEPDEFRLIVSLLPVSLILLITGFLFGVWVMNFIIGLFTQATLEFSIGNLWDISRFFGQILTTGVFLAIVFQFPVILTILIRLKLVKRALLIKHRPYVYAASLIIAAMLPPTDVFSLALLTLPLFFLFECTLLWNRRY